MGDVVDGFPVGRTADHLATGRLVLDSLVEALVRAGLNEPIVLEQGPVKAPCTCWEDVCFRDGVIGFIKGEHIDRLCSEQEVPPGARGFRLKSLLEAHRKCEDEFFKERFSRSPEAATYGAALEDVEAWTLCVIDKLLEDGIESR